MGILNFFGVNIAHIYPSYNMQQKGWQSSLNYTKSNSINQACATLS